MIKNWRDTLTDYTPAYNPGDWAVLSDRLQADASPRPWKRFLLLGLAAIALFTSGFLVRGLFSSETKTTAETEVTLPELAHQPSVPIADKTSAVLSTEDQATLVSTEGTIHPAPAALTLIADQQNTSEQRASAFIRPNVRGTYQATSIEAFTLEKTKDGRAGYSAAKSHHPSTDQLEETMEVVTAPRLNHTLDQALANSTHDTMQPVTADSSLQEGNARTALENSGAPTTTEALKEISTPEKTEIGLTLAPFFQSAHTKKASHLSMFSDATKSRFQTQELGFDLHINNRLYAGLGYGYRLWNETSPKPLQYRSHAPFCRVGINLPLYKGFNLVAQAGASMLFEKLEYEEQQIVDGEVVNTVKTLSGTSNGAYYGLGLNYSFNSSHSLYTLVETGERVFTIGYKYHLGKP